MNFHLTRHAAKALRRAWLDFFDESMSPNWFITFNFGMTARPERAQKSMTNFFDELQRRTFGEDWPAQLNRDGLLAVGFLEHKDSNTHYHVLAVLDRPLSQVLDTHGTRLWKSLERRGQIHAELTLDAKKVASYSSKDLAWRQTYDEIFIYKELLAKQSESQSNSDAALREAIRAAMKRPTYR